MNDMDDQVTPSGIDRLKELTVHLGPPAGVITAPGIKQYKTLQGNVLSWTIHWQREFAVCHAFISAGAVLGQHVHDEKEWLIVVSGGIVADLGTSEVKIEPRQELVIEPNTPHEVRSETDTYIIVITMPAADYIPKRSVHVS